MACGRNFLSKTTRMCPTPVRMYRQRTETSDEERLEADDARWQGRSISIRFMIVCWPPEPPMSVSLRAPPCLYQERTWPSSGPSTQSSEMTCVTRASDQSARAVYMPALWPASVTEVGGAILPFSLMEVIRLPSDAHLMDSDPTRPSTATKSAFTPLAANCPTMSWSDASQMQST